MRSAIFATGIVLIIIGSVLPQSLPVFRSFTVSGLDAICRSSLGQLGAMFSEEVREACGMVGIMMLIFNLIFIAGLALTIYGAVAKK